jgi:hypothetical protein
MTPIATTTWTLDSVQRLTELAREGNPLSVISLKLKRPPEEVRAKLAELKLTVPVDR